MVCTCTCVCRLIQCSVSEDGLLVFITDIPEQAIEEPQEKEAPVLQESSNGEQMASDGGNLGLKSVLSVGKTQSSWPDGSERPVVTFKENIKPREPSREPPRNHHLKDSGKERRDFGKGNGASGKGELKRDNKRKSELKKSAYDKPADAGKQVRPRPSSLSSDTAWLSDEAASCVQVKAQVELRKTPPTQTQTSCSSQFIPIHHPGAFPPLPSRPGGNTHTHTEGGDPAASVVSDSRLWLVPLQVSHPRPMLSRLLWRSQAFR